VRAKRELLLNAHRHRLRRDDLEDCYGQATVELLLSVRSGRAFAGGEHLAKALEQRFVSRVRDQLRATRGRSSAQTAREAALALGDIEDVEVEVLDTRAEVHELVARRMDLERIVRVAPQLTGDQRLVIASQVAGVGCAELCSREGWSSEKYRKVAQRGRVRLRALVAPDDAVSVERQRDAARDLSRERPSGRISK
jgi:hypothetical protein